jgi:hypothetical protein
MIEAKDTDSERRELAHRVSDGVEVALLWRRADDAVSVTITDRASGAAIEVDVRPDQALDAFRHPYAYVALRGALRTR